MERLTERNPAWIDDELWESACEPDCEEIDAVYRKLKNYEDLEEQNRFIKLPCKVGDIVYVPTRDFISELRIAHIIISKNNIFLHWMLNTGIYPNLDGVTIDKIGKTVFLTKAEAEEKLKELKNTKSKNVKEEYER